ncbi:hypothetical protein, partial [Thiolapillus sp.]|uniref:hypothetical protein n=1 Tax=Thiolapillus sp. TaxID=2017437 RepID=UPI0025D709F4
IVTLEILSLWETLCELHFFFCIPGPCKSVPHIGQLYRYIDIDTYDSFSKGGAWTGWFTFS